MDDSIKNTDIIKSFINMPIHVTRQQLMVLFSKDWEFHVIYKKKNKNVSSLDSIS